MRGKDDGPKLLPDFLKRAGIENSACSEWVVSVSSTVRFFSDEPQAKSPYARCPEMCGVCGSTDTVHLGDHYRGSKEPSRTSEIRCTSCANYTQYFWHGW